MSNALNVSLIIGAALSGTVQAAVGGVLAMKPEEATWWVRNLQAVIDREQAP